MIERWPSRKARLEHKINGFRDLAEDGWCLGGIPVSLAAIDQTLAFVDSLSECDEVGPEAYPCPDGSVQLEWWNREGRGDGRELELVFTGSTIRACWTNGQSLAGEGGVDNAEARDWVRWVRGEK